MRITYSLENHGERHTFVVALDPLTLALQLPPRAEPPAWARLESHRCAGCPLDPAVASHCPMAVALIEIQAFASRLDSFSPTSVTIGGPEREVRAEVPAQRAISSLMGLLVATCGCPEVAWLRPMARFHLPLASEEETIYRATSMYLLAQYFRRHAGLESDITLAGLQDRYRRLHEINMAMAARLKEAIDKDASINAVVLLDMYAKALPRTIDTAIEELAYVFKPYLE